MPLFRPHIRRCCRSALLIVPAGTLYLLAAANVLAATSNLRCGSRIISVGDTTYDVRQKCGRPDLIDAWEEAAHGYVSHFYDYGHERYRLPYLVKGPIQMERWTYDFGSNRLIQHLIFENGYLIRILSGRRGNP